MKELNRSLRRRAASIIINKIKTLSSSYLGECLLLDIFNTLFQGDNFDGPGVNHLMILPTTGLKILDLLGLSFYLANKVVDHAG
jgi:hypothetical protein